MKKRVHFLGIGGSGTSAAAAIAQAFGFEIDGCDLDIESEFTKPFLSDQLKKGHFPEHLEGVDILATTPAIFSLDPNNSELVSAKEKGIEILTWQQFVGKYLLAEKFVIAISGTHGKSTTTSMIAKVLEDSNLDPSVLVGTIVDEWGANYRIGKSKYFVIEADEFNDNFLALLPNIAVVTNIEMDHPEFFKDFDQYKDSFLKFLMQTKNKIVANLEDANVADVLKVVMKQSSVTAVDFTKNELKLSLKIPGKYNLSNACAAFSVGILLGLDPFLIRQSLSNYKGVGRRQEYLGQYKGAYVYTDFGHHPTEIKVTVNGIREKYPEKRIVLIYQPHMFSRTKHLFDDFVEVLRNLDVEQIFILDIYPSREVDTGIVSSKELADAIDKRTVKYLGPKKEVENFLKLVIRKNDVVIFMGAGDIDKIARRIADEN